MLRPGTDRLPVVVLLHGSGGIGGSITDWEQYFNAMGVATFVVDSFTARGIVSTVNDQAINLTARDDDRRLSGARSAHEATEGRSNTDCPYGLLSGWASDLYASMKRFQRMYGTVGQEFAAYVPGLCRVRHALSRRRGSDWKADSDVSRQRR